MHTRVTGHLSPDRRWLGGGGVRPGQDGRETNVYVYLFITVMCLHVYVTFMTRVTSNALTDNFISSIYFCCMFMDCGSARSKSMWAWGEHANSTPRVYMSMEPEISCCEATQCCNTPTHFNHNNKQLNKCKTLSYLSWSGSQ